MYHDVINYEPVLKHVIQQVQEQSNLSPDIEKKLEDIQNRWSELRDNILDQQQALDDVVPAAITCEEAWEEFEPHVTDVEARLSKIKCIPVEQKGLTRQQNILKVCENSI